VGQLQPMIEKFCSWLFFPFFKIQGKFLEKEFSKGTYP